MIEKINRIANPLTIIAIFATLAEIAGTVSLGLVDKSLQSVFVWFVMLFPILLVAVFFVTLNFNPKVLYAPGDFRDDKSFIATVSGAFDRPSLTVQRGDVTQLPKELPQPAHSGQGETKESLDSANAFIGFIMGRLESEMEQKKLWSISFGMEGEGYFLLNLELPKAVIASRRPNNITIIIQTQSDQGPIRLKAIGRGISDTDPKRFAEKVFAHISKLLDSWIDPKKLAAYEPPQKSKPDTGGNSRHPGHDDCH